jgi:hypothetical protein
VKKKGSPKGGKAMDTGAPAPMGAALIWVMFIISLAAKHRRRSRDVSSRRRVTREWPDPADECCICLDTYAPGKYARAARCGHVFHAVCFTRLMRSATSCPLCRTAL